MIYYSEKYDALLLVERVHDHCTWVRFCEKHSQIFKDDKTLRSVLNTMGFKLVGYL